jgi:PKD repeat protein
VTAPDQAAGSFHLGLDFFENITVAHEEGGQLYVETHGTGIADRVPLGPGTEPHLAFSLLGSYIAYAATASGAEGSRRIFLRSGIGSRWSLPQQVSSGEGDDRRPYLKVMEDGVPVTVWENWPLEGPGRIWFRRGTRPPVAVGRGDHPALVLDRWGRAHVFFLRDDDIFYSKESSTQPGLFAHAANVTQTPFILESAPTVAIHEKGRIFLCFERQGTLFLANDRTGDFSSPVVVAEGDAGRPALALSPNGAVGIAFEKAGDIYTTLGATFFLPPAEPAFLTSEPESLPSIAVDSFANVFVGFQRGGALYYATNAGVPQADFEADPLVGEAPLTVSFHDRSTGGVTGWSWDFGDASSSSERNPIHVFKTSGELTVRLRVSGPGGESPLAHEESILVLDPRNEMRIAGVDAFPGQQNVYVPVLAKHDKAAQGFTIAATYDPTAIAVRSVAFEDSNIVGLSPELFAVNISEDPLDPYITAGVLFDVTDPFDGRVFPPGINQRIANIVIDVSSLSMPGSTTRIQLKNQVGTPPLNNIFTVDGFTLLPTLGEGGTVSIRHLRFPPPRFFLRGDTDGNEVVNLTDAVLILGYLFTGTARPDCADAADVTDDGALDVSDALFTLSFLFKAGSFPHPPYPDMGLDPTGDRLEECLLR